MSTVFHILHVDDSPFDRQLVCDALEHESDQFVVTEAASSEEFQNYLTSNHYDLVLTDFNILGFQGLQVIDAVKKVCPLLPVIVLTGTGSEEVAVESMKRGAADYVIKNPHHIRRLPMAVLSAIERKRFLEERNASEQALRASEERLRAFANAMPDLAFILDDDGHYVQLLNAPTHLLHAPPEQMLGKLVSETLPESVSDQIIAAIRQTVETHQTQIVEYQLELPEGVVWFEGRTSLMETRVEQKKLVVYVARDITLRKESELRLRRERNLLRTLIDNVPDYIFVEDREGRFVTSNTAHAAAAQRLPSQMIGKAASEVFAPDLAKIFHDDDAKVMAAGEQLISEERVIHNAAGFRQCVLMTKVPLRNESDDVIGLVGIARDITHRKEIEEALRASEEHLRTVIAGTPVVLFTLDTNGVLTLLHGRGLGVFGDDYETFIGSIYP
jgi:PAS domain S-box-containing protein